MTFKQETLSTLLFGEKKNKVTVPDASSCEPQETLISKRPVEFLKGFTEDTVPSVNELRVMRISMETPFSPTP